jgi:hypothetical protein
MESSIIAGIKNGVDRQMFHESRTQTSGPARGSHSDALSALKLTKTAFLILRHRISRRRHPTIQGIERGVLKRTASVAGVVIIGQQQSKSGAVAEVQKAIDRSLAPKKRRPDRLFKRVWNQTKTHCRTRAATFFRSPQRFNSFSHQRSK